jgi:hypothetical protein
MVIIIFKIDMYTGTLLFLLLMGPVKTSYKEFFADNIPGDVNNLMKDMKLSEDNKKLIEAENLGIDERFRMDEIAKNKILKQIKSQVDFDPYKTNLSKDVIYEIYNKYFDNDIFIKLKNTNNDSKDYIASGNFKYLPKNNKVDYDLVTYQNLSNNVQIGINPLTDKGINNGTKINRG